MIEATFAIPGDIMLPTGGYAYARKVLDLLPNYGVHAHRLQLSSTFPYPDDEVIEATKCSFAQLNPDIPLLVDGLAYGALPPELVDQISAPVAALVHHPLAYETGVTQADRSRFIAFEMHALKRAVKVITTSRVTARLLRHEYGVPDSKLTIAEPGTLPACRAEGLGAPFKLLSIGALIPRKGYTVLMEALSKMTCQDWQLTIVGATNHDPDYTKRVREAILQFGLGEQIELTGALGDNELQARFKKADVFVMASLFEGYGMVLSEALARGLPIVCTTGGAMAETVPDNAALKVAPGDAKALAEALDLVLSEQALRKKLSDASWAFGSNLPRWEDCVGMIANLLKSLSKQTDQKNPDNKW